MKKTTLSIALGLSLAVLASSAQATPEPSYLNAYVTTGSTSSMAGATTYDFGTSSVNNSTFVTQNLPYTTYGAATYSGGDLFNVSTTGISGISARPVNSTGNYWSIQQGQTGTVTFTTGLSYYGFLWGSPDTKGWDTVTFYNGTTVLGSYGGTVVSTSNAWTETGYFNVTTTADKLITSVVFTANQNAFETDNHSFITAVPEPETYAMLIAGLGLVGAVARRRKQAQS